ncbi:antitoxin, type II toxin-antitoxin system family protein [Mycobacteroides abscessus 6G-0728-R]|nr:phd_YefM family protein [Mycobacteroides abscessus 6G-0125-S]EIU64228.1 phd_YefM family protein [Mycobacteroides abscessus 6G-0728-S]EIU74744.1 phd_YefM family protein [Mycobacteroides abscessus 6G-1108]EIV03093.1 antitoxin, type II toxin-antitoxin system family protein [Mycobacteroides abscessus 6G-0728-R]
MSDFVHDRLQFEFPGVGSLAMKIDEADMASATDVGRNTGRYVSEAADGRRIVIMNNHQPVAAIIGMADLRRLDALDIPVAGIAAQTPAQKVTLADLDIRPDGIPVGLTPTGHTAHINPLQHLLVAGNGASDMIGPLLAGVVEDGLDTAFVVASEQPVVIAYPKGRLPHVVSLATSLDIANEERVAEQIAGELDARSDLLRRHSVNTIDQYRRFNHDAGIIDHLIVVIDTADSVLGRQHSLSKVVDDIVQRGAALGASVWLFSPTATRHVIDACDAIEQRIALTTRTAIESRDIIGCADAADLTAGQAILQTRPGALTPITTFIRDDSLPPRPLESIGPPTGWPSIAQPPTVQQVLRLPNESTSTSNRFEAPIGVIDDPRAHRLVPFSLEFVSGAANLIRAQGPSTPSTQILLDALLTSSAQLYTPNELQFRYIGHSPEYRVFSSRELPNVASVHRWGEPTNELNEAITEAIETQSGAHTVVIVDDWRPFHAPEYEQETAGLNDAISRVVRMRQDTSPGVHILAICYGGPPPSRILLEKSLHSVYLSGIDPSLADSTTRAILRRLPNSPHHAAVAQGHLVLAAV